MDYSGLKKDDLRNICKEKNIEYTDSDKVADLKMKIENSQEVISTSIISETIEDDVVEANTSLEEVVETPEVTPHKVKAFYYGKAGRKYELGIFDDIKLARKALSRQGSDKTEIIPC